MERKPIQILLLATAQLLTPLVNIAMNSWQFHTAPTSVLQSVWATSSWFGIFSFFLVGPISAAAIYSVKIWSYPVFLLCSFLTLGGNLLTWSAYPESISLTLVLAVCALNIALVTYFILPAVRLAYFDPKVRWWEAKPRFHKPIVTTFGYKNQQAVGNILNFSEGGAYLQTDVVLETGNTINLQFELNNNVRSFCGHVVYAKAGEQSGCGVRFDHTPQTRKAAKATVRELKRVGATQQPAPRNIFSESYSLLSQMLRGKGMVPELSSVAKAKAQALRNQQNQTAGSADKSESDKVA